MAAMIAQNAVSGKTLRSASGAVVRATSNGPSGRAGGVQAASAATVAAAARTASILMARRETAGRGSVDRANATARATPARTGPRLLSLTSSLFPGLRRVASVARPMRLRLADDSPATVSLRGRQVASRGRGGPGPGAPSLSRMDALIRLEEVTKSYDSDATPAMDGVSMQIAPARRWR